MARSNIRVLALDLDGTLTNDEKIVTPRTRAALDAAAAQGVTIVLASGRPTAGILPLAKELGLDKKGGCVLAYNGGKIVDCVTGEALYQVQLGAEFVPELCEFAARQDVAILTYNSEGIVCERDQDVWANKECFTTKLPMLHVMIWPPMWTIRSAKCSSPLTLPGGMLSVLPERSSLRAGSTCTPPAPSSSRPCRWAWQRTGALPPCWSGWA